jgi:hypothetical protein
MSADQIIGQDNALITVTVDGKSIGRFETLSGGDASATVNKGRDADDPNREVTWAGRSTTTDVVVTRKYDRVRDQALAKALKKRVNKARATAQDQPRDDNDQPSGDPQDYAGRLTAVSTGNTDLNAGGGARMLSLTISVETSS